MDSLLILIRIMVAISMPAAGFFLFLTVESIPWLVSPPHGKRMYRIEQMAEKERSEVNLARLEGAKEVAKAAKWVSYFYAVVCLFGLVATTTLCSLSMWAGRKVKRMIRETGGLGSDVRSAP